VVIQFAQYAAGNKRHCLPRNDDIENLILEYFSQLRFDLPQLIGILANDWGAMHAVAVRQTGEWR